MHGSILPIGIDWNRKKGRTTTAIVECRCGALHDLPMPATMLNSGYTCASCRCLIQINPIMAYGLPPTRIAQPSREGDNG